MHIKSRVWGNSFHMGKGSNYHKKRLYDENFSVLEDYKNNLTIFLINFLDWKS